MPLNGLIMAMQWQLNQMPVQLQPTQDITTIRGFKSQLRQEQQPHPRLHRRPQLRLSSIDNSKGKAIHQNYQSLQFD